MAETLRSGDISTRLRRIAKLTREHPDWAFSSVSHVIDIDWLRAAYRLTRKDGSVGVDGQSAAEYAADLQSNLQSLLDRLQSGSYRAPPVRRVHIPKGSGGSTRPIGIPTLEDKVAQRAVVMLLEAIYEQDFLDCSFGFRPGRSAHKALQSLRNGMMSMGGGWVVELDIERFFDTLDRKQLRSFLDRRMRDGTIRRAIHKWLKAGVLEEGSISYPESGSPQGGVISPILANVYLHEVLDVWFEHEVRPRLRGDSFLVRFADDAVIVLACEDDARRVLDVLPKRFARFGLRLHPEKTRLVRFVRPGPAPPDGPPQRGTFDFLGFTHYWARSRRKQWVIKQKTAKDRLARGLRRISEWCRRHRHQPLRDQRDQLGLKLRGHYGYYGITGNYHSLGRFHREVQRIWRKWLCRRSNAARRPWKWFNALLQRLPLPRPRTVVHFSANP